jgi:transposase
VIYRDPLTQKIFHFVCSDLKITARTIADIYERRWAVELLFRWLKGHLDIRRLPTKTTNAIRTMLAAAVLFQLLLQLKKITDKFKGTLWGLLRSIRADLAKKCLADSGPPEGCRWNALTSKDLEP